MIELTDTTAAGIAAEFARARVRAGSPAMGMVMTLVVVVDDEEAEAALGNACAASHEHPARVLGVILGERRGDARVDAVVGTGSGSGWTGETALITLSGEVVDHPESVVLPLLLPDSPVVVWWPNDPPEDPAADALGSLGQRRITDAAMVSRSKSTALLTQARNYTKGNTDLAWTRLTPWRALLAAALDQHPVRVTAASVAAERVSPSADLLTTWLEDRLHVEVDRRGSRGPGITEVVLETAEGPIRVTRKDGKLATYSSPDRPDRPIALKRRPVEELLAEELRRLDEDDVYAATARRLAKESTR